ncbi:nucleotide sugar dehydrogenase [Candidatus Viridilinea mediisalina]|uniref:UDP-N-acetyl-D-glucosamine dehydrogenase n=1 Tax=Candidatus Viridilinea mediisalina TaxID=2024553 RepID=A0A2A6RLF8_9CHLR|nr:nucleotide sugar dehydrogenase [Candidatus Viridilinea mediisalina]PDW03773.1 UDP-N-acetyl-D-glucosamine dehydrogenase [Candidatus Viridilinea mediisalina]
MTSYEAALQAKLEACDAVVGVIGMGYVGLPLAVRAAAQGFRVLGFDVSPERVAQLNAGESYIGDVTSEALGQLRANGNLEASNAIERMAECDLLVICVPTPLNQTRDPDLSYIEAATRDIAQSLRPSHLVILESTTYPGTTCEVVQPILDERGLVVGHDYFLAFSPERIDPGQTSSQGFGVDNTPKVVGGVTAACTKLTSAFYRQITSQVVEVSSPAAAELTKLFENIFRAVNIALVNELALLCDRMNLNVWEVIDAAATKPYGFMKFTPGPGLGGHCIPIDPFYLTWKARAYDLVTRFIELAGEINTQMPRHVHDLVVRVLNRQRKALNGSTVLLLGVAYKPDVDDYRESPAFKVMDLLVADGATVITCDPHIDSFVSHAGEVYQTTPLTDELLGSCDCAVIITNHSAFPYQRIVELAPGVVDTRNATRMLSAELRERVVLI